MAVNDIYQLKLSGSYGAATWLNVFFYRVIVDTLSEATAGDLSVLFQSSVLSALAPLVVTGVTFGQVETINVREPTDFNIDTAPSPSGGAVSGEGYPANAAIRYQCQRPAPGFRSGYKRFIGIPEAAASANQWNPNATDAYALASALAEVLGVGSPQYQPVIVKRPVILGTLPTVSYVAESWTPRLIIGSQRSRIVDNQQAVSPP